MKIKSLKINGFGKLKDKDIEFADGINIIYGKNEAGKSTILRFITAMFYGLSKNKNGGIIPEIEKYEPWNQEEFSGKIQYSLDNNENYEVYRDFKKKSPQIFNKNLENITKNFSTDKTKGNQFFYEQIGLEEEIFTSSIITKQSEVKLDSKIQNTLIQKISNILGTGEDTTSYSTLVSKLKKKLNDEVGTTNTKERPINIVESKMLNLKKEKIELEKYQSYKFDIDEQINGLEEEIKKEQLDLDTLRTANIDIQKIKEDENRIKIKEEIINGLQEDINNLKKEKKEYISNKKIELSKSNILILILTFILALVTILILDSITKIVFSIPFIIYLIYIILKINKGNRRNKKSNIKLKEIEEKIKILNQNKEKQYEELKEFKEEYTFKKLKIKNKNNLTNLDNIVEEIDSKQKTINDENIKLHTLKIDNNNISSKLERLVNIQEELQSLEEEKNELEEKRDNIKRTLEYLEIAYNKMKEQITPKFTKELSSVMEKISDGKYKNVKVNLNGEIIVETDKGEYINAENLSIGTIDQLYLSLRIATIKEITKENMPIILDEAFAYYDDNRLENILNYLKNEYDNKQIIIFTCTKREKNILEKLNIDYKFIDID